MKTDGRIKRDLQAGKRVTARDYHPAAFHAAMSVLAGSLPILTGWQTCADDPITGLRLREKVYRLHVSALKVKEIAGAGASNTTPTVSQFPAKKKGFNT